MAEVDVAAGELGVDEEDLAMRATQTLRSKPDTYVCLRSNQA
jgi:hypothetical protein